MKLTKTDYRRAVTSFRSAFTVIELLVVVAIIAILASLLLPSLTRAKEITLSVKCKSNLKQMALGLQMYVQDNNGEYPAAGSGLDTDSWIQQVAKKWGWHSGC